MSVSTDDQYDEYDERSDMSAMLSKFEPEDGEIKIDWKFTMYRAKEFAEEKGIKKMVSMKITYANRSRSVDSIYCFAYSNFNTVVGRYKKHLEILLPATPQPTLEVLHSMVS